MKQLTFIAILTLLFSSNLVLAQSFPDNWESHDLSQYDMPFTIMAPASATFDYDSDMEELYIDAADDHFRIMISVYEETVEELIEEYKEEVEDEEIELVGYVHDTPNGFLAEERIEGDTDFEVYYAVRKGNQTFFFQTNPLFDELYTAEDGEHIFQACKAAAGM